MWDFNLEITKFLGFALIQDGVLKKKIMDFSEIETQHSLNHKKDAYRSLV